MWVLDPANSRELLDRLRPHSLSLDLDVVWCGEGWRALVSDCHNELAAAFPGYKLDAIRQSRGVLAFEASPRAGEATPDELALAREITDKYSRQSESICEWCGRPGSLQSSRLGWFTLCDQCADDLNTNDYPANRPAR